MSALGNLSVLSAEVRCEIWRYVLADALVPSRCLDAHFSFKAEPLPGSARFKRPRSQPRTSPRQPSFPKSLSVLLVSRSIYLEARPFLDHRCIAWFTFEEHHRDRCLSCVDNGQRCAARDMPKTSSIRRVAMNLSTLEMPLRFVDRCEDPHASSWDNIFPQLETMYVLCPTRKFGWVGWTESDLLERLNMPTTPEKMKVGNQYTSTIPSPANGHRLPRMLRTVLKQTNWKYPVKVYVEIKLTRRKVAVIEIDKMWNVKLEVVREFQAVDFSQC